MGLWQRVRELLQDGRDSAPRPSASAPTGDSQRPMQTTTTSPTLRKVPAASDVQGALRVLELHGNPSLQEVRTQYQRLARRYHPRASGEPSPGSHERGRGAQPDNTDDAVESRSATLAGSGRGNDADAAVIVLEALTEALELLECHLLPAPSAPPSAPPSAAPYDDTTDGRKPR
jgi:hypothetical protein